MAVLASGTAVSQLITVMVVPLLSRIYSPDQFGTLAMFMAFVTPLCMVACMRYEMAIMLPNNESKDAENILALSVLISIFIGVILFVLAIAFGQQIANIWDNSFLEGWLVFVGPTVTIHGIYSAFRMWSLRKRNIRQITISSVGQTGSQAAIQTAAGYFFKLGSAGLIWGNIISRIVSTIIISAPHLKKNTSRLVADCSLTKILKVAKRYKDFPLYQSWGNFLNSLSRGLIILMLGLFFSEDIVGYYFIGYRILNLPLKFLGSAIGDVYFEKGARENREGEAAYTLNLLIRTLSLITLPVALVFVFTAPQALSWILGSEWQEAGVYLQILTPLFAFRFISAPISNVFYIYEKQREALFWQFGLLAISIISIVLGGVLESIYLALSFYSATATIMYIIMLNMSINFAGLSWSQIIPLEIKIFKKVT